MGKEKRRNSEKRKEKSRDAARCRRGKETEVFTELAQNLPLPDYVSNQLDKASVMRLAISVLKIHNLLHEQSGDSSEESTTATTNNKNNNNNNSNTIATTKIDRLDQLYQKALEGFALILSQEGDIVYLTESVARYLGLQQVELMGQSLYEFTHPCDHEELKEMLTSSTSNNSSTTKKDELRTLFLRMKCTLTSKGRNVNLKSATYKVMKCSGRLVSCQDMGDARPGPTKSLQFLVGVAEPLPHPANIEVPLDSQTFVSKHTMDMRFVYCDDRIQALAGYRTEFMQDQSLFNFHHALDSELVEKAFRDLFSKGQTMTGAYRFLARNGGHVWVVTQATVINNGRTQKPQSVVCVHYVLSGVEDKEEIVSHVQCRPATALSSLLPPKVELNTESIFAPRTKEVDKGYVVPVELKGTVTYRNEEPEDLAYLAPNAGDDSVQLTFLGQDMLLSPVMKQEPMSSPSTPDMAYRKDHPSPNVAVSSNSSSRMSSPTDYLSVAVPGDVDAMDQFFSTISTGEKPGAEIDFDLRAPYIPMDSQEDLGLLPPSSNLLFNLSSDVNPGLFGRTEDVFGSKFAAEEPSPPLKRSMREMLEGSTAVASIEQPADTMYLQLKRPLDMNSLEKGPPAAKVSRLVGNSRPGGLSGAGVASSIVGTVAGPKTGTTNTTTNTNNSTTKGKPSVLLNLLTQGEDRVYGYKVSPMVAQPTQSKGLLVKRASSQLFPSLTNHDCEVNAPIATAHLLQGRELLQALDACAPKPRVITP